VPTIMELKVTAVESEARVGRLERDTFDADRSAGRYFRIGECKYLQFVAAQCCDQMREKIEHRCAQHSDPKDCPDRLITYIAKFREYGLVVHDGGSASVRIDYCPWCGSKLPDSQRDRWFEQMERLGIDPWSQDVPAEFEDERWLERHP
jgi:hypothetical protein